MKIGAVSLFVHELAAAHEFYESKPGLRRIAGEPGFGYCVYDAGPVQLVIDAVAADAPQEDHTLVGRFSGVSFAVADAQATFARLQALGVRFSHPPERQPWGGILATLVDPAENHLQLVQSRECGLTGPWTPRATRSSFGAYAGAVSTMPEDRMLTTGPSIMQAVHVKPWVARLSSCRQ